MTAVRGFQEVNFDELMEVGGGYDITIHLTDRVDVTLSQDDINNILSSADNARKALRVAIENALFPSGN